MLPSEVNAAVVATARSPYWRETDARLVLAAWMDSGQSMSAFARHFGLCAQRLRRWRRRLDGGGDGLDFHPVRLVERGLPLIEIADAAPPGAALELLLPQGRRISVGPGFDEETLVRLVRVVESLAC